MGPPIGIRRKTNNVSYSIYSCCTRFFGPLPQSDSGNKYILVCQDMFTRYVELYPVPNIAQDTLADKIYNQFIPRHGYVQEWVCDNGSPFNATFIQILAQLVDSHIRYTPPLHPESNGVVERFMSTLRRGILAFTNQTARNNDWDKKLKHFRFAYNTSFHNAIGDTPFFLTHGRDAHTTKFSSYVKSNGTTVLSKFKNELVETVRTAHEIANIKNEQQQWYTNDKPKFQKDELVLLLNSTQSNAAKQVSKKLLDPLIGPFRIINVLSSTTYDIESTELEKKILFFHVHVSRLKK